MTFEEFKALMERSAPGAPAPSPAPDSQADRRSDAIRIAVRMVLDGRLPAWEAFDFAHGILQFLNTGIPFRFEKGTIEGVPATEQVDFTKRTM